MDDISLPQDAPGGDDFDIESPSYAADNNGQAEDAESVPQDEDDEMEDLFGGDAEAQEEEQASEGEQLPSEELDRRRALEYEEEEMPPELAVEVKEAQVFFPNLPRPSSSNGEKWVVKIPNFVKLDSKPYHEETYIGPEHEDEELQHIDIRERDMTIKLRVENTLRWRWRKDEAGNDVRQSNSKIIRWSDGSMSLRLGKELFDINQSIDNAGGLTKKSFGGKAPSASQSQSQSAASGKTEGLTYLVAQHKRSQVLQSEALITGYMSLRPTGMQSDTHRMLVRAVGQKHSKISRLRMTADPTVDPEREQKELAKQHARKSTKRKTREEDFLDNSRARRSKNVREAAYSDDDDDDTQAYDVDRGSRRKGDYTPDDFVVSDEEDDDDDDDDDRSGRKKRRKDKVEELDDLDDLDAKAEAASARAHKAEAMDVESEEDDDGDEAEVKVRKKSGGGRRRRAVYDDDEDEDE